MSRQSIHTGRCCRSAVPCWTPDLYRCMPGSWVVSTGGTWGRDSRGGVGLQGGCRVQGAGIATAGARARCSRKQQGAEEGCGRCRGRGDKQGCRDDLARGPACDNVPSALVDHTCVWLSGWISEPGNGTWVQGRGTYGCTVVYRTANCRRGWPQSSSRLILLGWVCRR